MLRENVRLIKKVIQQNDCGHSPSCGLTSSRTRMPGMPGMPGTSCYIPVMVPGIWCARCWLHPQFLTFQIDNRLISMGMNHATDHAYIPLCLFFFFFFLLFSSVITILRSF
jgi:hypothetical protein